MPEKLALLSEPFPIEDVKQRRQGGILLDYISIDATIRRLNDVLGSEWSTRLSSPIDVRVLADGKYAAIVVLELEALGKVAIGTGADVAGDLDKVIKTALAEAIKKAGHQFGVGLYLWQESERAIVAKERKAAKVGSVKDLAYEGTPAEALGDGNF